VGEAKASGGGGVTRAAAFRDVGGFDPEVIAAEDDEICLRRRGWKVYRVDAEMGRHDAAMTRFGQWWRRAERAGYAYALGAHLHGAGPERHFVRQRRGVCVWGFALPATALAAAWPTWGLSLLLALLYPALAVRVYRGARRRGVAPRHAAYYAAACVIAKFPQFLGVCRFYARRLFRRPARIADHRAQARRRFHARMSDVGRGRPSRFTGRRLHRRLARQGAARRAGRATGGGLRPDRGAGRGVGRAVRR
jgi:hypothetical protein